jgi:hypothetical protein
MKIQEKTACNKSPYFGKDSNGLSNFLGKFLPFLTMFNNATGISQALLNSVGR